MLSFSPPPLLPLRDVAQIAGSPGVDWEEMERWVQQWKLRAVIRDAVSYASTMLGATLPSEFRSLTDTPPTRRERRAFEVYSTNRKMRGGEAVSTLWAIRGFRAKAAYVRGVLLPDRAFLAARTGGERGSYRRRWAVALGWLRTGRR
jgi:hypothetical protein